MPPDDKKQASLTSLAAGTTGQGQGTQPVSRAFQELTPLMGGAPSTPTIHEAGTPLDMQEFLEAVGRGEVQIPPSMMGQLSSAAQQYGLSLPAGFIELRTTPTSVQEQVEPGPEYFEAIEHGIVVPQPDLDAPKYWEEQWTTAHPQPDETMTGQVVETGERFVARQDVPPGEEDFEAVELGIVVPQPDLDAPKYWRDQWTTAFPQPGETLTGPVAKKTKFGGSRTGEVVRDLEWVPGEGWITPDPDAPESWIVGVKEPREHIAIIVDQRPVILKDVQTHDFTGTDGEEYVEITDKAGKTYVVPKLHEYDRVRSSDPQVLDAWLETKQGLDFLEVWPQAERTKWAGSRSDPEYTMDHSLKKEPKGITQEAAEALIREEIRAQLRRNNFSQAWLDDTGFLDAMTRYIYEADKHYFLTNEAWVIDAHITNEIETLLHAGKTEKVRARATAQYDRGLDYLEKRPVLAGRPKRVEFPKLRWSTRELVELLKKLDKATLGLKPEEYYKRKARNLLSRIETATESLLDRLRESGVAFHDPEHLKQLEGLKIPPGKAPKAVLDRIRDYVIEQLIRDPTQKWGILVQQGVADYVGAYNKLRAYLVDQAKKWGIGTVAGELFIPDSELEKYTIHILANWPTRWGFDKYDNGWGQEWIDNLLGIWREQYEAYVKETTPAKKPREQWGIRIKPSIKKAFVEKAKQAAETYMLYRYLEQAVKTGISDAVWDWVKGQLEFSPLDIQFKILTNQKLHDDSEYGWRDVLMDALLGRDTSKYVDDLKQIMSLPSWKDLKKAHAVLIKQLKTGDPALWAYVITMWILITAEMVLGGKKAPKFDARKLSRIARIGKGAGKSFFESYQAARQGARNTRNIQKGLAAARRRQAAAAMARAQEKQARAIARAKPGELPAGQRTMNAVEGSKTPRKRETTGGDIEDSKSAKKKRAPDDEPGELVAGNDNLYPDILRKETSMPDGGKIVEIDGGSEAGGITYWVNKDGNTTKVRGRFYPKDQQIKVEGRLDARGNRVKDRNKPVPEGHPPPPGKGKWNVWEIGHLFPESGAKNPNTSNIPDNLITEAWQINQGAKKRSENHARKLANKHPESKIEMEIEVDWTGVPTGSKKPKQVSKVRIFKDGVEVIGTGDSPPPFVMPDNKAKPRSPRGSKKRMK